MLDFVLYIQCLVWVCIGCGGKHLLNYLNRCLLPSRRLGGPRRRHHAGLHQGLRQDQGAVRLAGGAPGGLLLLHLRQQRLQPQPQPGQWGLRRRRGHAHRHQRHSAGEVRARLSVAMWLKRLTYVPTVLSRVCSLRGTFFKKMFF